MSKTKRLKQIVKTYEEIFNRIIKNYKLNAVSSTMYDCLDYNNGDSKVRIALVRNNQLKVSKQEPNKKSIEIISIVLDKALSTERINTSDTRETVTRQYRDGELTTLTSNIILTETNPPSTISIHLEDKKVVVNDRDVSLLYKDDHNDIESRYELLKSYYSKQQEPIETIREAVPRPKKSKRELLLEEQLRTYIRDEFDYEGPLEKRDLAELSLILNMLIKRNQDNPKQFKKTY